MKKIPVKPILISLGIGSILLGLTVIFFALGEIFFGFSRGLKVVSVPGIHEVDLDKPGFYTGRYLHQTPGPLPVDALSKLSVQLFFQETLENVPVLLNEPQVMTQMGQRAVVLFSFVIDKPGPYTMSLFYPDLQTSPAVQLYLVPQSTESLVPKLAVGFFFFLVFAGIGIFLLVKAVRLPPLSTL